LYALIRGNDIQILRSLLDTENTVIFLCLIEFYSHVSIHSPVSAPRISQDKVVGGNAILIDVCAMANYHDSVICSHIFGATRRNYIALVILEEDA